MYTKQILSSTTSIQTKYLTNGPKFILDFKKASQSGRSMVEMLGVLGIIGLLSVGGVSTYRYLFSVSEANKISNEILTDYTVSFDKDGIAKLGLVCAFTFDTVRRSCVIALAGKYCA